MSVPILKLGDVLVASIQAALSDHDLVELRDALAESVGRFRARGVVLDVGALDVVDSFATRTIRSIAYTAKLRGALPVVVGIQPDVAIAMVQLGLELEGIPTALDIEEGLELVQKRRPIGGRRGG
jgi:rsbT antagonist protein RsbS